MQAPRSFPAYTDGIHPCLSKYGVGLRQARFIAPTLRQRPPSTATVAATSVDIDDEAQFDDDTLPLSYYLRVGDYAKESARLHTSMTSMFNHDRWKAHRSTTRYIRHMLGILGSTTFRGLAEPLSSVAAVSTAVCCYEALLADGTLPSSLPSLLLPADPFSLTSFALALLLVFRTNTSYDRWLEVCMMWTGLSNRARDTLRQISSSTLSTKTSPLLPTVARWLAAYCRALKAELLFGGDETLPQQLQGLLTEEEIESMLASRQPATFAMAVLTELCNAAPMDETQRGRLGENLTFMDDAAGTCRRIFKVPIPVGYTRHTSRFMVTWLTALPLGLYANCGWLTIPLSVVTAFLLLGIDEIGVQIEEPFALVPLDQVCAELEKDLQAIVQEAATAKNTAAGALSSAGEIAAKALAMSATSSAAVPFTAAATQVLVNGNGNAT